MVSGRRWGGRGEEEEESGNVLGSYLSLAAASLQTGECWEGDARMRRQVAACVCVGGAGGEQLLHRTSLPPSLSLSGVT